MKKKILIVITLMVMCFTFAACGGSSGDSKSPYVGTWKAVSAGYGGMEMSVESVIGGEMTFELKADGKCILNVAGEEDSAEWTETEEGFKVDDEVTFKVDGNTATMDYSGVTITLEKE